jgi:outer membrane receptor protein involved in Fe transport
VRHIGIGAPDFLQRRAGRSAPLVRAIDASGLDVLDLSLTKPLRPWLDLNVEVDNLTDKIYYETQNYFESRTSPTAPAVARIHGTPGYPFGVTVGVTVRLGEK